jgi:hypothetical protein
MDKLIEFTSKAWNEYAIIVIYKRSRFKLEFKDLTEENQELLRNHTAGEYNINGTGYLSRGEILTDSLHFNFNNYGIPVKLIDHKLVATDYTKYKYNTQYGMKELNVQQNGFLVYCAPTGQGKTWFALSNLETLSRQFDTILYINLELSIDDIKNRCIDMNIIIPKNLYVSPLDNVEVIQNWSQDKGQCAYIIDNIDNLVGGGNDPFGAQLDFIKNLDRFLKDYNHHALVLTQLVKENNLNLIGKDGEINDGITTNILSGVKQLSYLSRTVMMTAYSAEIQSYVYKILKVGSAKIYES